MCSHDFTSTRGAVYGGWIFGQARANVKRAILLLVVTAGLLFAIHWAGSGTSRGRYFFIVDSAGYPTCIFK